MLEAMQMQKYRNKMGGFSEWKLTFITLYVLASRMKVIHISEGNDILKDFLILNLNSP